MDRVAKVGLYEFDLTDVSEEYIEDIESLLYCVFINAKLPFRTYKVRVEKDLFRIKGYILHITPMTPSCFDEIAFDVSGFFVDIKKLVINNDRIELDVCIIHGSLGCNTIILHLIN